MKGKSLLFLLAICLGMGIYLYYGVQKPSENRQANQDQENKLARGDLTELQKISIQTLGQKIELEKSNGSPSIWKMTSPTKDLAASGKIDNLVSALGRFKKSKVILEKEKVVSEKEKLAQFNLTPPRIRLEYKTGDLAQPVTLILGGSNPASTGVYTQVGSDGEVVLGTMDVDYLATQVPDDFREMRLTTVDSNQFAEVEIQNKTGRIKFARDANKQWTMTAPFQNLPVDAEYIRSELQKVSYIRANRFVDTVPEVLKSPEVRVIVGFEEKVSDERTNENDKRPHGVELTMGRMPKKLPNNSVKKPDPDDAFEYYAKSDKTQAATIARFHFDNFSRPATEYIRKTFEIFDPAQIKHLTITQSKEKPIEVTRDGDSFQVSQGNQKAKGIKTKIESALQQLRSFRSTKFVKVVDKIPTTSFLAEIETGDGKKLKFAVDAQKDFSDLWFVDGDLKMQYLLNKDPLRLSEFSFTALTSDAATAKPETKTDSKLDQVKDLVKPSESVKAK